MGAQAEADRVVFSTGMPARAARHKYWTLAAICMGVFMLLVDVSIVVVALPSIRTALHAGFSDLQWTIDAYALSLAALLLPTGSLADVLGSRRVFGAGLVIFTFGSLLCGLSDSGAMLIAFRTFQGIGGAAMFATSMALVAQTFHGAERGFAFGIWGAVSGVALGVGPLLGGLLTSYISWRWIFFVNLPIGVIAIAITFTRISEFRPSTARRIDVPGFVVFTAGLFSLFYGLTEAGLRSWGDSVVVASFAVAVVLLGLFPAIERHQREPMFKLELFRKPAFVGGLVAAFGMNGSLFAMILYLTLYLQDALHYSALASGLQLATVTAAMALAAVPAGRMSQRVPVRWLIGPGLVLVGVGLLLMGGITADSSWTHLIIGFALAGLGAGLVNPPLVSTAIGVVRPHDAGMASGINTTFRQIGIATAVAAFGTIFSSGLAGATAATLPAQFAATINELLWIAAVVAIVSGVVSVGLLRPRDFVVHEAEAEPQRSPVPA
jgi:EmrB/QacA subfamily drug resistance transporter